MLKSDKLNPNSFSSSARSEAMLFTSNHLFSQWKPSCGSLSDMGIKALFTPLQRVFSPALSLSIVSWPPTEITSRCCNFVPSNKVSLELYYLKSSGVSRQIEWTTCAYICCQCAGITLLHASKLFSLIWEQLLCLRSAFIWEKIVRVVKTPITATFVVDFNLNVELSFPYESG